MEYVPEKLEISFFNYNTEIIIGIIVICIICFYLSFKQQPYKSKIKNNYSYYLKEKNIIIVGPADYVNHGKFIDSFDVVVRINRGHNMINDPNKYGKRTDILYHCVSQNNEDGGKIPEDNNIKFIKFTFPNNKNKYGGGEKYHYNNIKMKDNMLIVDHKKYLRFENKIQTMPNAGTTAIWDLLNYDIKTLYIIGFTLFQTDYSKSYREKVYGQTNNTGLAALNAMKNTGNHNQKKIANYYLKNVITDKRVTYDKEFIKGINKTLFN